MQKTLFTLLGILFLSLSLKAQISNGGRPYSFAAALPEEVDTKKVGALPIAKLREEDEANLKQGLPLRIGMIVPASYSLSNSGTWTTLRNGDRIWRLNIQVDGALATSLYYDNFRLPAGSRLYVYNGDHSQVIGSYSDANNAETGLFATEILKGSTTVLEYYEPKAVKGQGRFTITGVNNIYSNKIPESKSSMDKTVGASGSCNVNVNCPEGANWQNQKRAVAKIIFKNGSSSYLCTGSLVNNARKNCKPYFLTANHCGSNASAADFNQWIFYFNYEAPGCTNPSGEPVSNTITGCVQRARSGDAGSVDGSDFQLLEFNQSVPSSYNVYYAGWNANAAASPSGVCIHHPAGDIKKISAYSAPLTATNYGGGGSAPYTHWKAIWVQTTTNWSVTEGGSSGSPLFNNNGQIVGQLSGGPSSCNATAANKFDYYGKMDRSWTSMGSDALHQLKPWLDPDNTGVLSLNGSNYPCNDTTGPQKCTDPYEPNNTLATAATISSGVDVRGNINTASDSDYFKIVIADTSKITIVLDNLGANFDVRLLSSTGAQLAISQKTGTQADSISYNGPAATYYVQVYGKNGAVYDSTCYRLITTVTPIIVACTDILEPNNTLATAAAIATGTNIRALIATSTDVDYYKFTTTAAQPHIEILLANLPGDYDVKLYNPAGTQIGISQNGSTTSERIVYNNGAPGTYSVQVYGYSGAFSASQCYQLTANISSTPKVASPAAKSDKQDIEEGKSGKDFRIYPVPVKDRVFVEINSHENRLQVITVTDMSGKIVYNQQHRIVAGYNRLEVVMPAALKDGIYIIAAGRGHTKKFIMQKQ
ncbi:pre-peptidase C-terminal domain-containing protein [Chitinophaga solisilvae]|uniref:pre-peptidase C-terminal domain-containing protein n=1 Tax=Chitinophaga solisilvae TaxID=1233460 RepID=UPI001371E868|nr:pre-peptidase C-terminal domain-containing protein [Chitinophaga solisilvae]